MPHFIGESAIMQQPKVVRIEPGKAIFRMVMQTADEVNQNRRLYPRPVLEQAMSDIKDRMNRRAFIGELDHPFPSGNETFDEVRQTTVSLREVSHVIRDYEWKGNNLVGELETTGALAGELLILLKDKIGIGISMRGMAELVRGEDYNTVKGPMMIITFDMVSQPSHKTALVDFNEMSFESKVLCESASQICLNGRCYLPNYFDKLVETKVIKFFDRWI